jgi:hypothetical protein
MSSAPEKPSIVLFDDDNGRIKTWRAKLEAVDGLQDRFEILAPEADQFAQVFESLKDRQSESRGAQEGASDAAQILDTADIVIVDFDLTPARGRSDSMETQTLKSLRGSFGDTFAYLTRCYTSAAYTVLVNQTFYQSTFDLTMREFDHSYADLNITDMDLGNPGLWDGVPRRGAFRPWHWPRLQDSGGFIRGLVDQIDLRARVLETLGFDEPRIYDLFDPQQLEVFLGVDPREATFEWLIGSSSRFGTLSEHEQPPETTRKKMAAIAVTHWLERFVVPSQNILVDAPHLAQRRPHLVRGELTLEALDLLADLSPAGRVSEVLDTESLSGAQTKASAWTMREVWLWPDCPRGPIPEDQFVFCEDGSYFQPLDDAQEFRSELPGPFKTRFVDDIERVDGFAVDYRPERRFYE